VDSSEKLTMLEHRWLFRNTASKPGRAVSITPINSDFTFISAGRILLDATAPRIVADNEGSETTLLVLHGSGRVSVGGQSFPVGRFDGVYIPRGEEFMVETDGSLDVLEGSAPTTQIFPVAHVRFDDVLNDPALTLPVGGDSSSRVIHKVLAENIQGSRLLTGVTMSKPGHWTSWPPHEHAGTQEELYLFFDIPSPGFGTQYIYTDLASPELIAPVYSDDAVTVVKGYHPNVGAPGFPINFAWILCSLEEETHRKVGGVNVQKEFATP
jgi:5-deoxy-glucuronate isomerase